MLLLQGLGFCLASLFISTNIAACMTHTEAAHAKDVSLACLVACDSVGGIIAQDAYLTSQPSL